MKQLLFLTKGLPAGQDERQPATTAPQTWSAIGMLVAGVGLSCAGFLVPPLGKIDDSVLWLFAQCLLYAGSILSVSSYVNGKISEIQQLGPQQAIRQSGQTDGLVSQDAPPGTGPLPDAPGAAGNSPVPHAAGRARPAS